MREQAEILGASWRIVSLGSVEALTEALSDIGAVIHAAGPFVVTAPPMLEACLRAQTHYLDVSGRIAGLPEAFGRDGEAVRAGVMLMPGAAWSVAATDCLAAHVARRLPAAKYLRLGMTQSRLYSRGTARSAFGLMSSEVVIRRNGRLTTVPIGRMEREFDYRRGGAKKHGAELARRVVRLSHDRHSQHRSLHGGRRSRSFPRAADRADRRSAPIAGSTPPASRQRRRSCRKGPAEGARKLAQPVIVAEAEDAWRRVSRARLTTATDTTLPRSPQSPSPSGSSAASSNLASRRPRGSMARISSWHRGHDADRSRSAADEKSRGAGLPQPIA